jgi:prevent-host-death family protein
MTTTTITQAKNGLSALIDRVKAGESIVILDRGTPVARLEPIVRRGHSDGRIERLERIGHVRPGVAAPPTDLIHQPGPKVAGAASVVASLIDERRGGH